MKGGEGKGSGSKRNKHEHSGRDTLNILPFQGGLAASNQISAHKHLQYSNSKECTLGWLVNDKSVVGRTWDHMGAYGCLVLQALQVVSGRFRSPPSFRLGARTLRTSRCARKDFVAVIKLSSGPYRDVIQPYGDGLQPTMISSCNSQRS